MIKSITLGILSALFFSFTFILNKEIGVNGGHWIWSSSLRYVFMLFMLGFHLILSNQLKPVLIEVKKNIVPWFLWSHIGFGVFYTMLTFAASYSESWLVASTWQVTIIAGALLSPFIKGKESKLSTTRNLPILPLIFSSLIIFGVTLINLQEANDFDIISIIKTILPIILAAFAYPLGNRKTMELSSSKLTTLQRVFAMTLFSMPLWITLMIVGLTMDIKPNIYQVNQSFIVALFSGVIATTLLFRACEKVKHDLVKLAIIESTQSLEVFFTLLGGTLIFHDKMPNALGKIGISIIIIGMILNSLIPFFTQRNPHLIKKKN